MSATATIDPPTKTQLATGFIDMKAADLQRIIRVSAPAASTDSYRPILTCAHVEFDRDTKRLVVTTTDSYRIYRQAVTVDTPNWAGPFDVLIPAAWLSRWARTRFAKRDMVTLAVGNDRCTLTTGDETTSVKLLRADFPGTAKIFDGEQPDKDPDTVVGFNPVYLGAVFKAAHAFTGHNAVQVTHLDPLKPCRFKVKRDGDLLDIVLMPVRMS